MNKKSFYGLLAVLLLSLTVRAAEPFAVWSIPAELLAGAGAVMRLHEHHFQVKSRTEAVETVHYAVTILNEEGQSYTRLEVPYNKLSKVNGLEGTLYNAEGKAIRRLKRSDISDLSAISDASLFEDSRTRSAEFTYADYPFTVEFRYEVTTTNTMAYPAWFPQMDNKLALESATFQVRMPTGQELRYKMLNQLAAPERSDQPDGRVYTWRLHRRQPVEQESYAPYYTNLGPGVMTAPTDFGLEDRQGRMLGWQELGRFLYELNAGRDQLPASIQQEVRQLVANEATIPAKIQKVVAFVQQQTRYVSIQVGIGGWQTVPASVVAEKGYGDCKALSNYTQALLKTVGIPSFMALVSAGRQSGDVLPDFPASHFNHMIVCVPVASDTVWIECTSQHNPAGYLGSFTSNRHALLLTPEGGKLVRTPTYRPADNRQNRSVALRLDASGAARAEVRTMYTGLQTETIESMMRNASPDDQRQWLYKQFAVPTFTLSSFSFEEANAKWPAIVERLSVELPQCATRSGNRLFWVPNQLSSDQTLPLAADHRISPFRLSFGYEDRDTVVCQFPDELGVEYLFEPVAIESRFGRYQASATAEGNTVRYIRSLVIEGGQYAPELYADYVDFRRRIAKADRLQILFRVKN